MTVTVTPTVEASNVPPRVRLDVAGTTETATTVMRLNPDGTRSPVRTSDGNALPLPGTVTVVDYGDGTASSDVVTFNADDTAVATVADFGDGTAPESVTGGGGLLYDYEAPFGELVSFTTLESPDVVSAEVVVPAAQVWLIHPGVPGLSVPVTLGDGSGSGWTRAVARGVFQVMGRATPVVVTDGARKSRDGKIVVLTQSAAGRSALEDLTSDTGILLMNVPVQLGYHLTTAYVAVGDMDYAPVVGKMFEQWFTATLPFVEVDRPAGGTQSERTWADVIAENATWADVLTKYPTWLDLLAGP